jgi:hypothetical protein
VDIRGGFGFGELCSGLALSGTKVSIQVSLVPCRVVAMFSVEVVVFAGLVFADLSKL